MQEENMPHSLLRELSPKEESTLCKIAQGAASQVCFRPDDVSRLQNFGFVKTPGGVPVLTPLGAQRIAIIARTATARP
jgi:hypothetical protein